MATANDTSLPKKSDRTLDLVSYVSFLFFVVAAVTLYDVGARYLFSSPTIWALELAIGLSAVAKMTGCAAATIADQHIRIDSMHHHIVKYVPDGILEVLRSSATLVFLGGLGYGALKQAQSSILAGETSGTVWNSYQPMVIKTAIAASCAIMLATAVMRIIRMIVART